LEIDLSNKKNRLRVRKYYAKEYMSLQFEIATPAHTLPILAMQEKFYAIDQYPFDVSKAEPVLQHFLSSPELGKIWLLRLQEITIGYLALTFCYSFEFGGRIAFLDELFIEEDFRQQGFGSQALTYIITEAKNLNLRVLHLEAERHNKAGKALYHKFGFKDHDRHLLTKSI